MVRNRNNPFNVNHPLYSLTQSLINVYGTTIVDSIKPFVGQYVLSTGLPNVGNEFKAVAVDKGFIFIGDITFFLNGATADSPLVVAVQVPSPYSTGIAFQEIPRALQKLGGVVNLNGIMAANLVAFFDDFSTSVKAYFNGFLVSYT